MLSLWHASQAFLAVFASPSVCISVCPSAPEALGVQVRECVEQVVLCRQVRERDCGGEELRMKTGGSKRRTARSVFQPHRSTTAAMAAAGNVTSRTGRQTDSQPRAAVDVSRLVIFDCALSVHHVNVLRRPGGEEAGQKEEPVVLRGACNHDAIDAGRRSQCARRTGATRTHAARPPQRWREQEAAVGHWARCCRLAGQLYHHAPGRAPAAPRATCSPRACATRRAAAPG